VAQPRPESGRLELFVGGEGGPVEAEAGLFDLQGRSVATLHRGPLARGLSVLAWDGRGRDGRTLEGGLYFLRFASPLAPRSPASCGFADPPQPPFRQYFDRVGPAPLC